MIGPLVTVFGLLTCVFGWASGHADPTLGLILSVGGGLVVGAGITIIYSEGP